MELFNIVFNQVAMMCMMMFAGGVAYHQKWIDDIGVKQISNFLLYIVNPLTIIAAYQIDFSWDRLYVLTKTFIVGMIVAVVTLLFVNTFFKKLDGVERYGIAFANSGFIGIPLVKAVLSEGAVFYLSAYLVAANFIIWTYGIYMITRDKKYMTVQKAIFNPGTIGTVLGLILFISPIKLSPLLFNGVNTLGNLNTPLAMIILGAYIVKSDLKTLFSSRHLYFLSFLRLVIVPLLTLLLLVILPVGDHTIAMTIFIACSAPAAVNTMIFSLQFGGDSELGARFVSISSILSMISLPVILTLASYVI